MADYTIYQNVRKPNYRLITASGSPLPDEAVPADWKEYATRPDSQVSQATKDAVNQYGYELTKVEVRFEEVSSGWSDK